MKTWMMMLAMVAVLGMAGLADAKGAGKHKAKGGLKGKIESVVANTFTMTVGGGKKNAAAAKSLTVKFDNNTTVTIDGAAGGKLDASLVGKKVSVVGTQSGDTVTATSVAVTTKAHHKKKAA